MYATNNLCGKLKSSPIYLPWLFTSGYGLWRKTHKSSANNYPKLTILKGICNQLHLLKLISPFVPLFT